MVRFNHKQSPQFDHWLDAFVSGKSTPVNETAADETSQPADSDQLRKAARQFHGLAAQADRQQDEFATTDRLDYIWEHVMATSRVVSPSAITPAVPSTSFQGRSSGMAPPPRLGSRWQTAINSVLAAVLILGLAFGTWKTYGNLTGGGGGDAEPSQIAALANQDGTPESGATLTGTPVANNSLVVLPKAEDCTVEPLTVDEVMEIVDDPGGPGYESEEAAKAVATRVTGAAIDDTGNEFNVTPSQENIDQIMAVHREWVACAMANSWFQMWALSSRQVVARDVTERLYPTYLTREDGRALLEQLKETGTAGNLGPASESYASLLIHPDPGFSNQVAPGTIQLGWAQVDWQGHIVDQESASYATQKERCCAITGGGGYFEYWWNPGLGRWEIIDTDAGGRG